MANREPIANATGGALAKSAAEHSQQAPHPSAVMDNGLDAAAAGSPFVEIGDSDGDWRCESGEDVK